MTISGLVNVLKNNLQNNKYSMHLSPLDIKYIDTLLDGNPEMFNQIHSMVDEIIGDGVLDIHDVPKIVLLVSKIYKTHLIGEIIKQVKILSVIRFTVDSLLESGLIPLPEIEIIIIKKIVDVSIDLLSTNIDIIEEEAKTCWAWCKHVFCSCHTVSVTKPPAQTLPVALPPSSEHLRCSRVVTPKGGSPTELVVKRLEAPCQTTPKCNCDCTKCKNVVDPKCNCTKNNMKCNCSEKCNCSKYNVIM